MAETKAGPFDVVVIGSGPGGYVAAIRAGQHGLRVALVEKDDKLGGTCLWRGCIPTKVLLHNAYLYEQILDAKKLGIEVENVKLNFAQLMKSKDDILRRQGNGVSYLMKKNKVQVFTGYGKIKKAGLVEVKGADKAVTLLETKAIIVATGSEAKAFPGMEPDGKGIITNIEALALESLPKSLVVIGGGAVGIEFASIYRSFGSEVAVVEMLPQILPLEDEEIAKELEKILKKRGIKIYTGSKTEAIKAGKGGYEVKLGGASSETLTAEKVLVAVGRKPNVENLGLETTKAKVEKGFIQVDGYMQTAEPGVYAIGDVVPTPLLAHVASAEGIVAADHIKGIEVQPINYGRIPNVTYCDPQVASVGLTEKKAREKGHDIKIGKFPFGPVGKARIEHEEDGFVKLIADSKYGEILGVHILHAKAGEMIPEACAILNGEMTAEALAHTIHPHPTLSEAIMEAAHSIYGLPIHM